ncbi:hypothetical protein [Legionella maceachernii]|nr:hypothetical protein [Legionella maceachernii]
MRDLLDWVIAKSREVPRFAWDDSGMRPERSEEPPGWGYCQEV